MYEEPDFVKCTFCRRISVGHFILEDDAVVVFRDAHPLTRGHLHIVPRRHTNDFFMLPPHTEDNIVDALQQSWQWLQENLRPDGYNIGVNIGDVSGQSIPHSNIHLIPRYHGDLLDRPRGSRWLLGGKGARSRWSLQEALCEEPLLETRRSLALPHPRPLGAGHTVIVPRRKEADYFALQREEQADLWDALRQAERSLRGRHSPQGYNIALDGGEVAGQKEPYTLLHLLPRFQGDAPEPYGVRWMAGEHSDYKSRGIGH